MRRAHNLTPTTDKLELVKVCYKFRTYFRPSQTSSKKVFFVHLNMSDTCETIRLRSLRDERGFWGVRVEKNTRNSFPSRNFVDWMGALLGVESNDNSSFRDNTIKGFYVTNVKGTKIEERVERTTKDLVSAQSSTSKASFILTPDISKRFIYFISFFSFIYLFINFFTLVTISHLLSIENI